MRAWGIAAVTVIAISLASGCGTNGEATVAAPEAGAAATQKTAAEASVQQYAGLVNSSIKDMRGTWQKYDDGLCLIDDSDFVCAASAITLSIEAETLILKLDSAKKPGVPAFIGAPPPEIVNLVAETATAAAAVRSNIGEAGEVLGAPGDLMFAVGRLLDAFDKWEPYI